MGTIIIITIIGAITSLIIGSVWYSNATPMGRLHMQYLGFDKLSVEEQKKMMDEARPHMWKSFLGQFILSALTSFFIGLVTVQGTANSETSGMIIGYLILAWLCFTVPVVGSTIIWGNIDRKIAWKKFFADASSYIVTIVIISAIAQLFV